MHKFLLLVTISGLGVSTPITKQKEDVRVVGGEDIDITAAPYQVSIVYAGTHLCGASIIANDLILTAAHCFKSSNPRDYSIRVGSSSNFKGGFLYPVGDLQLHPKFSMSNMDNDIALMWLSIPLKFSASVAPIRMVEQGEEIKDGDMTIITGWGNLREGGGYPLSLQMVSLPIVNPSLCKKAYDKIYVITPAMLCAGIPEGGKDSCQGDSGGPLVHNGRLAGVVSWGLGCARPRYPGVYTKISALRRWIDQNSYYLRQKHLRP
ncbi:unnamed protein product [Parnassius mnemosyne]|uniref:Peptidase S1 domain-containing protein n=1 Tax=Parnassius mnemosyne TaxID=213953 RepID=A0AAV1L590_9NEOP